MYMIKSGILRIFCAFFQLLCLQIAILIAVCFISTETLVTFLC